MDSIKKSWLRRWSWKKLFVRGFMLSIGLMAITVGWIHWQLRSSLPKLDGEQRVPGLTSAVTIDRDAQGVPTIISDARVDTALALGFLHAQDRFFQMDLQRRVSAGKLSELFGPGVVGVDEEFRKHRFQQLATTVINALPEGHRQVVDAYTQGVNLGLECLGAKPFEYVLLRRKPEPWKNDDCILVMMTMVCDLQPMDAGPEIGLGILQESVPPAVFNFLVRSGSEWDAALDNSVLEVPSVPPAEVWSLRQASPRASAPATASVEPQHSEFLFPRLGPDFRVGSNNWAVSGSLGSQGRALLASDMHLGLRVPATWYRAVMKTPTMDGTTRRLVGVTLPGTPILVEGSNGSVAWGLTNSYGDFGDVVELKLVPGEIDEYLTPDGPRKLERFSEQISFAGGAKTTDYEWSIWGPVVDRRDDRIFVHHWVGNDPQAFDIQFMELESAANTTKAMQLANRSGLPHANVVVADREGHIGWTLCGRIPRRTAAPSVVPVDWSTGNGLWQGYLDPDEYPRVLNPSDGRLWTANNRILGGDFLNTVGDGRFALGARARQIRDRLRERQSFSESDLLAIQLDDEAIFLRQWQSELWDVIKDNRKSVSPEFVEAVEQWGQRANTSSVGYRLVNEFRRR